MSVLKIKDQNNDWIQIPTIKGDKGDPFTYADFTPEQLESLKGKDGISPTVSVASDTSDDYRLSFTDETHTVTTPNLIPEAEKIFDVYPTDTSSGAVASFPDGADDIPLKSCIVQVNPVQDLHGYDHPWPAGGGKNKFNEVYPSIVSALRYMPIFVGDGTYTLSTSTPLNTENATNLFLLAGNVSSGASSADNGVYAGHPKTVESVDGYVTIAYRNANGVNPASYETQLELGSTATDYAPYSNECPISGFTGCEVHRTGKNLLDTTEWEEDSYIGADGATGHENGQHYSVNYSPIKTGVYDIAIPRASTGSRVRIHGYDKDKQWVKQVWTEALDPGTDVYHTQITIDAGIKYIRISIRSAITDVQLELGSTATEYEPYQGNTYPITFPSEAGTVYGGYVDVINGELVVEYVRRRVDNNLGRLDFTTSRARYTVADASIANTSTTYADPRYMCTVFPKTFATSQNGLMFTRNAEETTAFFVFRGLESFGIENTLEGWNAFLESHEVYVTYKLAEPIHYPLAPTEIKTLLGQNNLWADTGDTEVEYRADVTEYINKKITEAVSALT